MQSNGMFNKQSLILSHKSHFDTYLLDFLVYGFEHDFNAFAEVLHGFGTCVNLTQIHILAVAFLWTQVHCFQKYVHCC